MVSIIIPAHNYGFCIAETLDSLLKQTYTNWECLVIDDGSVDNTREIVNKYVLNDNRIQYHYQDCQGVSAARNAGFIKAVGEYIQFLDADDLLLDKKLEIHVDFLLKNKEVDIIYSDVRYFFSGNLDILSHSLDMQNIEWLPKINYKEETGMAYLALNNIVPIQAPLSRVTLLHKVGLFDTSMRYCEDWDYWFRCVATGGVIHYLHNKDAMSLVRVHSISASQNRTALGKGASQMSQKVLKYIEENPHVVTPSQLAGLRRVKAMEYVKEKQYVKGLLLFFRTLNKADDSQISLWDMFYWIRKTHL